MTAGTWTVGELTERVHAATPEHERARDEVVSLLVLLEDGGVDSEIGYGESSMRHRQIVLGGGGPAEFLHIVYDEDGDVDHCYIEWAEWDGRGLWMIPAAWNDDLLAALGQTP